MKKILFLLLIILFSANVYAENYNKKLTFDTYVFLKKYKNKENISTKSDKSTYFLQSKDGIKYTKVYLKVNENYSKSKLEELGCKELVKTKSIALISIPINQIEKIAEFDFIEKIEITKQPNLFLDKALPATNVDKVHQGIVTNLKQSYFGEGVIVGMVDLGFDFTHPMFQDENGNCRIKRAWILDTTTNGNHPNGFEAGTLYTDSSIIKNEVKHSVSLFSGYAGHGTHTTGIAAGSPIKCVDNEYSGIASEADIAIVDLEMYNTVDISMDWPDAMDVVAISSLEAFTYLFRYADSVNKPMVINYSAGYDSQFDGKSLFDIAVGELINEKPKGRILVASAGNSANNGISMPHKHLEFNLTSTDSAVISKKIPLEDMWGGMQFWGEENKDYIVELQVKNKANNQKITKLITFSTANPIDFNSDNIIDTTFTYQSANSEQELNLVGTRIAPSNVTNRQGIRFVLFDADEENLDSLIIIVRGNNQIVHAWNEDIEFTSLKTSNVSNNSNYTVSSPASLDEVIGVGSYISKNLYNPYLVGRISEFSSQGPILNGTIKPDITAPGEEIFSAINSFLEGDINYHFPDRDMMQNGNYGVGGMDGTSMSSPMVAGIVALMLGINPELTYSEIKDILKITAINDQYTGDAKNNKSNIWGWGKIDAYAIMKRLETTSIQEQQDFTFNVFPNPISNIVNIQVKDETPFVVNIYDMEGKLVYLSSIQNEKQIDLEALPIGTYFIELYNNKSKSLQKVVKN